MTRVKDIGRLIILVWVIYFFSAHGLKICHHLSEPVVVKGLEGELSPPPSGPYGGVILSTDISFGQTDYTCGIASLFLLCERLGVEIDEKKIRHLLPSKEEKMSMLELARIANVMGLKAQGLFLTLPELREIEKPVIAFIKDNHFVLVDNVWRKQVLVIDPACGKVLLKENKFMKIWNGYVLSVSKD